ncbi:MAG: phosphoadenylyl-sulfate reductase, partial [Alphaproteobacteria bacterium]
ETHRLMETVRRRYGLMVKVYFPDYAAVETYVKDHGTNGFFDSVELRQACCHIRKVEPLSRALAGKRAWITGMRRTQAATRTNLAVAERDAVHGLRKFNPLANWSIDEVWAYIRRFDVPYSALYDQGYASIGCAPCTRPITAGEDIRAGRWWWEDPDSKECGLHPRKDAL